VNTRKGAAGCLRRSWETLAPPNFGALALVVGHGSPKTLKLLMPGSPDGEIIPFDVFAER